MFTTALVHFENEPTVFMIVHLQVTSDISY